MLAARYGHSAAVQAIVDAKAELNAQDKVSGDIMVGTTEILLTQNEFRRVIQPFCWLLRRATSVPYRCS
jgi:hypothetical protein